MRSVSKLKNALLILGNAHSSLAIERPMLSTDARLSE